MFLKIGSITLPIFTLAWPMGGKVDWRIVIVGHLLSMAFLPLGIRLAFI